ncbi:MAG: TlpA family protein disulfide reductase [Phycisphaerae bacterium]|nr:TlpA family protein disulfide reductase [Phycisphaerae bacterium]
MTARMFLGATLFATAMLWAPPALAQQKTPDRPVPPSLQKPAQDRQRDAKKLEDPKAILARAADAIKKANVLRYRAQVGGEGVTTAAKTAVSFARADAGGWKISVVGDLLAKGPDASTKPLRTIEVGFDAITARSIRQNEKVVAEFDIRKPEDLRLFFNNHDAGASVVWEAIEDEPFASMLASPTLKTIGTDNVEGATCDVVQYEAAGADGATQIVEIAISIDDRLPRRVSRASKPAKPDEKPTSRVTTMTEVVPNDGVLGAFVLSTPDGFMVKSETPRKPKPEAPKREQGPKQPVAERGLLAKGSDAPAWTLKDSDAKEVSLSDYKGKVVVLDFWGSWCPPCRAAMPGIQKLHERYKDKGVAVVGMNFERNAAANPAKFMKDNGYTYALVLKAETIAEKYKVSGWPTFYILDTQGKVLWSAVGHDPAHEEQMEQVIEEALK